MSLKLETQKGLYKASTIINKIKDRNYNSGGKKYRIEEKRIEEKRKIINILKENNSATANNVLVSLCVCVCVCVCVCMGSVLFSDLFNQSSTLTALVC